jgi:membrane protease YdiL (CAAX protease family)
MKQFYDLMKKVPLLPGILGVVFSIVFMKVVGAGYSSVGVEGMLIRIALTLVTLLFLCLISGAKVFENSANETGYALKKLLPFLIYALIAGGLYFVVAINSNPMKTGWPVILIIVLVEMLFVGLFEELTYRALINDAILYQYREKKGVFVAIAVVSCCVFGIIHVIGADVSTPLAFGQAAMKTINCGLWGFSFLVIYWKTHNIWAGALAHAFYDACTVFTRYVVEGQEAAGGYVMEGNIEAEGVAISKGVVALGVGMIEFVFMLILTIVMIKVLKSIDFKKIREEW